MAEPYSMDLVQGQRYRRGFRYKVGGVAQDLTTFSWRAQARQKEAYNSPLIADFTAYLTLDGSDPTALWLDIPASKTMEIGLSKVATTAAWDLFLWPTGSEDDAFVLVQGPVTLDKSATDMR